ncbi:MAG: penicillin-binding protein 1A [Rhodospirillales bacterium]|nr:penicillin-binding protein 1A [Rhodospirillales bacterium]
MRFFWYTVMALFSLGMIGLVVGIVGAIYLVSWYGRDLPEYAQLKDYEPPVITRLYAGDGRLMAEYAEEKRVFVPIEEIPDIVKNAFIAAEDKNFYTHPGIDYFAIMRAVIRNLQGESLQGASTITQQVAKNFLLTNERTYTRKIREAILAYRMERALSKDRLLELYLNEIYLGAGSYGVAAAALNYFNKSLDELQIHEAAFLAALPKAPNNYHPVRHHEAALDRRNWIIGRMEEDGYIGEGEGSLAKDMPLEMVNADNARTVNAPYFAEEVRRKLIDRYGDEILYGGGLAVRTSLDPRLQNIAARALRDGLVEYDRRHGYRGPVAHWESIEDWPERLESLPIPGKPDDWKTGLVLKVTNGEATVGLSDKSRAPLYLKHLGWARKTKDKGYLGPNVTSVKDVLQEGDVIMIDRVDVDGEKVWGLRQIPAVNGAIVALDPHTGRILAMEGGWSYEQSQFNRVTQATRQPGSAFKPFVYLAALDKGFTPATLVLDAPLVIDQGPGLPKWRPSNYSNEYYGPTPIRVGIEKSRNLMTVRLAEYVGMDSIVDYTKKFGVMDDLPPLLANSLGSGETTLLRLTTGYAQFVNGGKKINPTMIDRIQDRRGTTVFNHDTRPCAYCGSRVAWEEQDVPKIPDIREQIADPRRVYQIVSMLEGVVQRGTGVRIKSLNRPLAGKTGTTNDSKDTWFIGFSPDLAVGVFVGFDDPKPMGKKETGSSVAVPIWKEFMEQALENTPPTPFRVPPGVRHVQINAETGARAQPGDERVIWEAFLVGTEPTEKMYILDGSGINLLPSLGGSPQNNASIGTGGLY